MRIALALAAAALVGCGTPDQTTNIYVINPGNDAEVDTGSSAETAVADSGAPELDAAGDAAADAAAANRYLFPLASDGLTFTADGVSLAGTTAASPITGTRDVALIDGVSPTRFIPTINFKAYGSTTCELWMSITAPDGYVVTQTVLDVSKGESWTRTDIPATSHPYGGKVTLKFWRENCNPTAQLFVKTSTFDFVK